MATKTKEVVHTAYGEASAAEVLEILDACYAARANLCIVGKPGVGKSALLTQYSMDKFGTPPIILIGSQMAPEDVMGLPSRGHDVLNGKEVVTTDYGMNVWEKQLLSGERKVLFLDEFSNTPRSVASALLSMLSSRTFSDGRKIPDDVMIVMAMNDEETAADYNELSAPMVNRITFVSYCPSPEEVYEGLGGGWFSDEEIAAWSETEQGWRDRIVSFLRSTNGAYNLMLNDIGNGMEETENAAWNPDEETSSAEREILTSTWCSPRSWDNVARILANTRWDPAQVTAIQERILNGTVGRKATVQMLEFVRSRSSIDPFSLIKEPSQISWNVAEDDVRFNELCEIARSVNEAVKKCDGQQGRPTVRQALEFYRKVLDLGGGPLFMNAYVQDQHGPREYFATHIPEDTDARSWNSEMVDILIAYSEANLIPTEN